MVKRYKVTIEDLVYQVSVESIEDSSEGARSDPHSITSGIKGAVSSARSAVPPARSATPDSRPIPPAVKPAIPAPRPTAPPVKPAVAAGSGKTIVAPLPGNMWKVKTAAGQVVKRGDVLFIIEAMKMENEIFAPCDGTVTSVSVSEGGAVNTGDVLCVIR